MAIDLRKRIVDLSKKAAFATNQHGIEGRCARVVLVLDISASMNRLSGGLSMFLLRIAEDWASQMSRIRDAHTDDTHLIRFDNTYYRLCRPGPETFQVKVTPGTGRVDEGITLTLQVCDLYVTHIGNRLFGRYASTVDRLTPQALTLDQAVHELPTAQGDRVFELQSMLVFCVAESLRNDLIATTVGQMIGATMGDPILRGPAVQLPIRDYLPIARTWGQASDAVFQALSPEAQRIVLRPRSELSLAERRFYERVDETKIPPNLLRSARTIKVLKRPSSSTTMRG